MSRPQMTPQPLGSADPAAAVRGARAMLIEETGSMQTVTVYDCEKLRPGNVVAGPTVIHSPLTTIVLHRGDTARMDGLRNLVLEIA